MLSVSSKRTSYLWLPLLLIVSNSCLASEDKFREIFPIPRIAEYQQGAIPVGSKISLCADASLDSAKIQMMAKDASEYMTRRYGKSFQISVVSDGKQADGVRVVMLRLEDVDKKLAKKLFTSPYLPKKLPDGPRRKQSYIIRSFLSEKNPTVYLVSSSEQGMYYGLFGLVQLLRLENNEFTLRGADVIDWPAFEVRMTSALSKLIKGRGYPVSLQREHILFKAALLRVTHGKGGEGGITSEQQYALDRWLRLCAGYWNRPKLKAPLTRYNWSDSASLKGWAGYATIHSAYPGRGAYVWHDATDAGWWHVYLDDFWNKRDPVDRKNYPNDPTPAKADVVRHAAIIDAVVKANPSIDILLTLPCYYDDPQRDDLPRVKLLREYLKEVGAAIPESVRDRFYWILEERSPESVAAYRKYLGNKIINYLYTPLWKGGTWDTNYTRAKLHDGKYEGLFYDGSFNGLCDFVGMMAAQYLWNPDLPTSDAWIKENLAPRAARLAYGPAWKKMMTYFFMNLNAKQAVKESNARNLRKLKYRIGEAEKKLESSLKKMPTQWEYAREIVSYNQVVLQKMKKVVDENLELAGKEIPLKGVKCTTDAPGTGDIHAAVLGKGKWVSAKTPGPHWVELKLPRPYVLTRISISIPKTYGYSWRSGEIQAEVNEVWKKVARFGKVEDWPILCDFDDLKTDRLRIILHKPWDWSKAPRNDMQLTGIKLFGRTAPKDPKGVVRLDGTWGFRLDPKKTGIKDKLFEQTDFKKGWHEISVPSRFEDSTVPGVVGYDGWAWYAMTFDLPPSWKGRVVKVRFGAVDDEAEVWLNGKRIGEHRKEGEDDVHWWEEAFLFDISNQINWGGPNRLVVLVNDMQLEGGIWKSVFVHLDDGPGALRD